MLLWYLSITLSCSAVHSLAKQTGQAFQATFTVAECTIHGQSFPEHSRFIHTLSLTIYIYVSFSMQKLERCMHRTNERMQQRVIVVLSSKFREYDTQALVVNMKYIHIRDICITLKGTTGCGDAACKWLKWNLKGSRIACQSEIRRTARYGKKNKPIYILADATRLIMRKKIKPRRGPMMLFWSIFILRVK